METYEETANVFSYNGQQQQTALKTLLDCQNVCSASSTCSGFDFTRSNECWLHTESTITQKGSGMGVSQYKKNACATDAVCVETFEETANVFSYEGQLQSAITTVSDCQNACSADSTCAGVDFTNAGECWLHTESTIFKQGSGMGVSQYKRHLCSPGTTTVVCVETFEQTANTFSYEGQLQSAITTVSDCQNACSADSTCAGFDFANVLECWLHTESTIFKQGSGMGVSQYRKTSCNAGTNT